MAIKEPKKVEMELWKIIHRRKAAISATAWCITGREVCTARTKPYCDKCCLQDICAKAGVE